MSKWKQLWDKKGQDLNINKSAVLESLFQVSGYQSKAATTTLDEWVEYINAVADECGMKSTDSVYEVGCGAGSFLYNICDRVTKVGGSDYAPELVKHAAKIIKSDDIHPYEAADIPVEPLYDVVVAAGCFIYFPDKAYATRVLETMYKKAKRVVALVDVGDEAKQEAAIEKRREIVGPDYDKLYAGLEHLYFPREYFEDFATAHGMTCKIVRHPIKDYPYRYNVFMSKEGG